MSWRDAPIVQPANRPPPAGGGWRDAPVVQPAEPPEPTLVDRIMGGASAAGRLGSVGLQGARQGAGNLIGLPADLVNMAPQALNLIPGVDGVPTFTGMAGRPDVFFGDQAAQALGAPADAARAGLGAAGIDVPEVQPETGPERMTARVGEELGAAAVPVGGALAAGARVTRDQARNLPEILRMFVEPAHLNPARFVRREGAVTAGAGAGAGTANEIVGGRETTGQQFADLVGAISGALAVGAGSAGWNALSQITRAARNDPNYIDNVVRQRATDAIADSSDLPRSPDGSPLDTDPLVSQIMGGDSPQAAIPGYRDSLADRTGDAGIAALEYQRQSGSGAGRFAARRGENTAAIDSAMRDVEPQGSPGALRETLETERTSRLDAARDTTQRARRSFDDASAQLNSTLTGGDRGANIRAALEDASDSAYAVVREAWAPLNRSRETVNVGPLADSFSEIDQGLGMAGRNRFRPDEADIPEALMRPGGEDTPTGLLGPDGQPLMRPGAPPVTEVELLEVTDLRSALTDAQREARNRKSSPEVRVIGDHIRAIDDYLDASVPPALREQYDAARAATSDFSDRFTRPQSPIAQTLDRREGQYRVPDSGVARRFVQSDEKNVAAFESLMREAGTDDRVRNSVRDQILSDVSARNLLDRPDQLDAYLGRYSQVFEQFPDLRRQLGDAGSVRRQLASAERAEESLNLMLTKNGRSAVANYLQFGDANAQTAMRNVIASKDPARAMDELLTFVGDAPEAVEGARRLFWERMQQAGRSGGETTRSVSGDQPWMPRALKGFLDDPRVTAVAERLYRDNPEHLERIREIADGLQNANIRERMRAPATSGTAQGIAPSMETLASRSFAVQRGVVGIPFTLTNLGGIVARRIVSRAQNAALERTLDEALLNPEFAAALLRENNPANRAALNRMAKSYLGNQASTFTRMLNEADEEESADVTIDTIMR